MPPRQYFYLLDRDGVLWHDGTALDDERFLRQFFARLGDNDTGEHREYPFVSRCAGELNFVRPQATVIVFRRLLPGSRLEYTGGLTVPFSPSDLRVGRDHELLHTAPVGGFGRLKTPVAMSLAECIEERDDGYWWSGVEGRRRIDALAD